MHACDGNEDRTAAFEFYARSTLDAGKLAEHLSIAILGCGGWILDLKEHGDGLVSLLWEFECARSMEVYGVLVALGLELSRHAHLSMTQLWQCARHGHCVRRLPVTRIRLTVETGSRALVALAPKARGSAS